MTDVQKVRELQGKVMKDIAAGALIPMMRLGDELGLFEKLFKLGPSTPMELSLKTNFDERYLKEWLLALAAAKYISYDNANGSFYLTD